MGLWRGLKCFDQESEAMNYGKSDEDGRKRGVHSFQHLLQDGDHVARVRT